MKHWRPTTVEDHSDGTSTVTTHQDATDILNNNKELLNDYGDKLTFGKQQHGMRVASIPVGVWEKWMQETNGAIEKDPKLMKKYLNDPDNAFSTHYTNEAITMWLYNPGQAGATQTNFAPLNNSVYYIARR